ncbi:MAG: hypothetical protein HC923_13120 [Myxococcales bacterium]|nr:hypothetical protein [Myxococcales bacterium]
MDSPLDGELVERSLGKKILDYDRDGEAHYGLASAFIKSMRGSDPDAAVYYMTRMLEAGEDPRFVLRRLIIFASEDIGLADPSALQTATAALRAYEVVGLPEGVLPITQATLHLALAPKSNSVLTTYGRARKEVLASGSLPVPKNLLNASTSFDERRGHGAGYRYPHDLGVFAANETYLPEQIAGTTFYVGIEAGEEKELLARRRAPDRASTRAAIDDGVTRSPSAEGGER